MSSSTPEFKVTKLGDLRNKITKLIELDEIIRPLSKTVGSAATSETLFVQGERAVRNLMAVGALHESKFTDAMKAYGAEIANVSKDARAVFNAYKTWVDRKKKELMSVKTGMSVERLTKALSVLYELIAFTQANGTRRLQEEFDRRDRDRDRYGRSYSSYSRGTSYRETMVSRIRQVKQALGPFSAYTPGAIAGTDDFAAQALQLFGKLEGMSITVYHDSVGEVAIDLEELKEVLDKWQKSEQEKKLEQGVDIGALVAKGPSIEGLKELIKTNSPVLNEFVASATVPVEPTKLDAFIGLLTIPELYERIGKQLVNQINSLQSEISDMLSKTDPSSDSSPLIGGLPGIPGVKGASAAAESSAKAAKHKAVEKVRDLMQEVASKIMLGSAEIEAKRPEALDKLRAAIDALGNLSDISTTLTIGANGQIVSADGSSSGSGSVITTGSGEAMYRSIDPNRLDNYITALADHKTAVQQHPMGTRISNSLKRLMDRLTELNTNWLSNKGVDQGVPVDVSVREQRKKALMDAKVEALIAFEQRARAAVGSYVRYQIRFIGHEHRTAAAYMAYWTALKTTIKDDKIKKRLEEYNKLKEDMIKLVAAQIHSDARQIVLKAYQTVAANDGVQLDEQRAMVVDEAFQEHQEMLQNQTRRLQIMYLKGSPSILDEFSDPRIITIYCLKALRVGTAWVSLRIAGNVFQRMYDKRVYGVMGGLPPSPLVFVGIALAVELAITLGIVVLLMALGRILKGVDGMPFDSGLFKAWFVDVMVSTVLVGVILCIIAITIKRKKYFRYKYEGDRGVRAMQAMAIYTYVVAVLLPFYRLTYV